MGREIKRVALDFDYPLGKVWWGYYCTPIFCHENYSAGCDECKEFARIMGVPKEKYGDCPDFDKRFSALYQAMEPPAGDGWQVWETVSEGSPITPVFASKEGLIDYLQSENYNWGISRPMSKAAAEAFVNAGWVPSGAVINGKYVNGENIPNTIKKEVPDDQN